MKYVAALCAYVTSPLITLMGSCSSVGKMVMMKEVVVKIQDPTAHMQTSSWGGKLIPRFLPMEPTVPCVAVAAILRDERLCE